MTSVEVRVVLQNSKGKEYKVKGRYWSDGTILCDNPIPKAAPDFKHLYLDNSMLNPDDASRVYWMRSTESGVEGLSRFRIKSVMAFIAPPPKKKPNTQ